MAHSPRLNPRARSPSDAENSVNEQIHGLDRVSGRPDTAAHL